MHCKELYTVTVTYTHAQTHTCSHTHTDFVTMIFHIDMVTGASAIITWLLSVVIETVLVWFYLTGHDADFTFLLSSSSNIQSQTGLQYSVKQLNSHIPLDPFVIIRHSPNSLNVNVIECHRKRVRRGQQFSLIATMVLFDGNTKLIAVSR